MNGINFIKKINIDTEEYKLKKLKLDKSKIKIYGNYVSGLYQNSFLQVCKQLTLNKQVQLVRESLNNYDSYAIAVYYGEFKLGYIPVNEKNMLANLMRRNIPVYGTITYLNQKKYIQALAIEVLF